MTSLLPGFKEQIGACAAELAREPRPTPKAWHRSRGAAGGLVLAALLTGGVAYATEGLWSPIMGDDDRGRPVASGAPLSAQLVERFAVWRREQSESDRGLGSLKALRWQSGGLAIQTGGVRRVGSAPGGEAIVVIPFAHAVKSEGVDGATRQICLWVEDPSEAGGMGCAGTERAARYGVELITVQAHLRSSGSAQTAQRDKDGSYARVPADPHELRRVRKPMRDQPHGTTLPPHLGVVAVSGLAHWAALVPDGVARVRVGPRGHEVTARVRDNLAQLTTQERYLQPVVWLDAAGNDITPPTPQR